MIKSNTVFVIGAGASKEVGLPTGDELKLQIANKLQMVRVQGSLRTTDGVIQSALLQHVNQSGGSSGYSLVDYVRAAEQMSGAMPLTRSVDNYMEAHQADERTQVCGKLAIAASIMDAERASNLNRDPNSSALLRFNIIAGTWFVRFFQMVCEGCSLADVNGLLDHVSIINFNYDRCVEHFLMMAVQQHYGLEESAAVDVVARMRHFHPYGTVGPWHERGGHSAFGAVTADPGLLLGMSARIRTFSERSEEPQGLAALKDAVAQAEVIVLLGFGFHQINMDLMQPAEGRSRVKRVYFTAYGLSEADVFIIRAQIRSLLPNSAMANGLARRVRPVASTCGDFLRDYGRELARR